MPNQQIDNPANLIDIALAEFELQAPELTDAELLALLPTDAELLALLPTEAELRTLFEGL